MLHKCTLSEFLPPRANDPGPRSIVKKLCISCVSSCQHSIILRNTCINVYPLLAVIRTWRLPSPPLCGIAGVLSSGQIQGEYL